jgi:hypothetical protein
MKGDDVLAEPYVPEQFLMVKESVNVVDVMSKFFVTVDYMTYYMDSGRDKSHIEFHHDGIFKVLSRYSKMTHKRWLPLVMNSDGDLYILQIHGNDRDRYPPLKGCQYMLRRANRLTELQLLHCIDYFCKTHVEFIEWFQSRMRLKR